MSRVLILAAMLFALTAPALAQPGVLNVQARLIAEHETVAPGQTVTIALEEIIRPGWHTYWINPGAAGEPMKLKWSVPYGWVPGDIQWPTPKQIPVVNLMGYGYEDKVWLLMDFKVSVDARPGDVATLKADATWQVCKEQCVPEEAPLLLQLRIGTKPSVDLGVAADFAAARAKLPTASPWKISYAAGNAIDMFVAAPELAAAHPASAVFFPLTQRVIDDAAPQQLGFADNGLVLRLAPDKHFVNAKAALDGVLVLTSADASVQALKVAALPGVVPKVDFSAASQLGLALALLFAFAGGLILNVMPCVLPVLALKAFALARTDPAHARVEGISYTAGALASFAALGLAIILLQQSGAILGWGFQLQEPLVVAGVALLMFAIGLNLLGVFVLEPVSAGSRFAGKEGATGAFFTGVLAVAVAAPCTAPFMAAALGYALTQSAAVALAVFLALGLGFAAPCLLLSLWPAAIRAVPRPGAWMLRLKQILAIPMYATAIWFAWVLTQQTGLRGFYFLLGAMLAVAIGAYIWTATRPLETRRRNIGALATLVALLVALSCLYVIPGSTASAVATRTDAYTAKRLADIRAQQRPVFVNATAAWCITCLVNEQAVLERASVRQLFAANNVAVLTADWTNRDSAVTQLLRDQGRSGVPLYLYYAPGSSTPVILPQILTEQAIADAIAQ